MWKAEEGYDKPPSNKQSREQLPMLQQDPLQMELELDTAIIEVTPDTPLLKASLGGEAALEATFLTPAVPHYGSIVISGALPTMGPGAEGLKPNTWFVRGYLREPGDPQSPGDAGERWSVMGHYDRVTGKLQSHYHTWEMSEVVDDFKHLFSMKGKSMPQERGQFTSSISKYFSEKAHELTSSRTLCYSYSGSPDNGDDNKNNNNDELQLVVQELEGCSFQAAGGGGPHAVELWNGSGGYARLPESILGAMDKGEDITFEFGAVMRSGGINRWLISYQQYAEAKQYRIKHFTHQLLLPSGTNILE